MPISIMNKPGQLVPVELWTPIAEVESGALDQLGRVARLPWVFHHVAVMPDVHVGKGATVGSVIALKDAVSPATVGVDIGCGMGAIRTSLVASDLPDNLDALRSSIETAIPVGFNSHDDPAFGGSSAEVIKREGVKLFSEYTSLTDKVQDLEGRAKRQVGTLGGGNHFIEVSLDEGNRVWLVLHSGSRNIGLQLAQYHIAIAKKLAHNQDLPDRDLSVFLAGTPEMKAYVNDLLWAQRYAFFNRRVMFELLKNAFLTSLMNSPGFGGYTKATEVKFDEPILCHHNYVSQETHFGENVVLTRKGAISARLGERGIIPGSMGTKSYIVTGLGNPESFNSASHGAGRRMSRGEALRKFTVEDLVKQTEGVNCRKDIGVLDEIPGSYKDVEAVMANQADLVRIDTTLKQVLSVKGGK